MSRPKVSSGWAMLMGCLFAGCAVNPATNEDREASFAPHEGRKIGGVAVREFVLLRSAILLTGDQIEVVDPDSEAGSGEARFKFRLPPDDAGFDIGTAAAVDRRGYLVTAGHCVSGRDDVYVVFPTSDRSLRIEKARVVWARTPFAVGGFDFALLRVSSSLESVFQWAPGSEVGTAVVSAGASPLPTESKQEPFKLGLAPFGGTFVRAVDKRFRGVPYRIVVHDSPVGEGNSGGPLVDGRGRLIAVHSGIRFRIGSKECYAVRPDLDWLADTIERDYQSQ